MQTVETFNLIASPAEPSLAIAPVAVAAPAAAGVLAADGANGPLHVRFVSTDSELASLADDWNRLAGAVPFRRFEWLETWWRHYRQADWRLYTLVAEDAENHAVAIAPWYMSRTASGGRVVRLLGSGEVCSEYLTVLTENGCEAAAATALADWLSGEGSDDWDLLLLEAIEAGDPATSALAREFAARGQTVHERQAMNCWRCELPDNWDGFLATLSKQRRDRVKRLIRRNYDAGRAQLHVAKTAEEFDRGFQIVTDLHQRRRRSLGQPGCFAAPRFASFHAEVSRRFFELGMLRLVWTELEGGPVAAEYDFVGPKTVYYYQTGLEPEAIEENPGWLGLAGSLRRAIEDGYQTFDFLRGDEAYKSSWGAQSRPTIDLRIVAPHAKARWRHAAWLAQQQLRDWAKRRFSGSQNST